MTKNKYVKNYNPAPSVVEGLQEILQFEKMKHEKKINGLKLSSAQKRQAKNLNKTKFDLITKIFLSIANVLYFFEFIGKSTDVNYQEHALVREVFEKDIMGIFGAKTISNKIFEKGNDSLLASLIDAAILYRNFVPSNFRMLLLEYMQYAVSQTISFMSISEFGDEVSSKIIAQDMGRALAWVRLFAQKVNSDSQKTHKKTITSNK